MLTRRLAGRDATNLVLRANAGHPPAILVSRDGTVRELASTAPAIGWTHDLRAEERSVPLREGDVLMIYTDGITESLDPAGDEFGTQSLARLAAAHPDGSPAEIVELLVREIGEFSAHAPAADDRTLVVAKVL